MQVHTTHHVDASEPRSDGFHDYYYEYDVMVFREGANALVARSYSDRPSEVHFLRAEMNSTPRPLTEIDIGGPLAAEAIVYLRALGKTDIHWLSGDGEGEGDEPCNRRLEIDELVVRRLRIVEDLRPPRLEAVALSAPRASKE